MKTVSLAAALALALVTAAPAAWADEGMVSRAEYEQLKSEFEALKREVRELRKTSQTTEQQVQQTAQKQEQVLATVRGAEKRGVELLPESALKPGWERARVPGWMDAGKLKFMNARIARAGEMDVYMGVDTVGRFQALAQDDVVDSVGASSVVSKHLSPGFQTAYGNLSFLADFDNDVELFFDIFIADKPHADQLQGNEGYILLRDLPGPLGETSWGQALFDKVDIKLGQFELDYGDSHYRRSTNASSWRNPLVGNYVIDPRSTEVGGEILSHPGDLLPFGWLVGVGSGGETQDFQKNHGLSLHGKVWGNPAENLRLSSSVYWVDHAKNPASSRANLFRSNRSGGPYAGVLDDGSAPGQVVVGAGQDLFAAEAALTWERNPWEFFSQFGWVRDHDSNGSSGGTPSNAWLYYSGEGKYNFTERLYGALRYSGAKALALTSASDSTRDLGSDGIVHRIQVGGGYWLTKTLLLKGEYVFQQYDGFDADGSQVSGVDAWLDPNFRGVIAEASFSF
ncbi:MAG: hypothetical protein COV76_04495 [Candidatus Omnitrophica bacterium CG11_big_fil_rev_8_21_14_0_20_64_10]|nr:MAG: hypothetical protein COV76_04495 [Candidatus Omnitrophica bacterium CG11_big_fil_rev_8_21_14_0_20_64_10]